jgi:transcriptional regulator with XRE-family HTH domain
MNAARKPVRRIKDADKPTTLASAPPAPRPTGSAEDAEAQRQRIGEEIRSLRRVRGMTLAELARITRRSVGYLSQLERGRSEASVGVLQHIAQALGVQVGWFFPADDGAPAAERSVVVRKANRRRLGFASGITEYLLSPNLSGQLELVYTLLDPGADSGDAYTHQGEEAGVVLRGQLRLWVDGEEFALEAGDSFSYPSHLPHRYLNPGDEVTEALWAVTPPTY